MNLTFDDGYQFGLGAFETLALVNGQPIWLEAHEARMRQTLDWLGITLPADWKNRFQTYIDRNGEGMGVVKILASANNLSFTARPNPYETLESRPGFVLGLSDIRRNESSPFVRHKTFNYGDSILAKRQAAKNGIDEPIFCNSCGELTEGAVSNLFLSKTVNSTHHPSRLGSYRVLFGLISVTAMMLRKKRFCPMKSELLTNVLLRIPSWASCRFVSLSLTSFPFQKRLRQRSSSKTI